MDPESGIWGLINSVVGKIEEIVSDRVEGQRLKAESGRPEAGR